MNILFVLHTPKDPLTAVYATVARQAEFLSTQGHHTLILVPTDFSILKRLSSRCYPLCYPLVIAVWLAGCAQNYDLVMFHSYSGWVFNLVRHLLPVAKQLRTITSFHGLEPLYYQRLKAQMARCGQPLRWRYRLLHGLLMHPLIGASCRRSNLVLCLNRQEAEHLAKRGWAEPSRIAVISNGIPPTFFGARRPNSVARRLLFVGQWLEMKGVSYLAEAFEQLAQRVPELELWCIGTQVSKATVLAAFPVTLRPRLHVRSRLGPAEMEQAYREADIFVFPTLSEGSSQALLEAMAAALPIVTTAVGAAPDMLTDGVHALLVPTADATALAGAVQRMLDDYSLRKRLGEQARLKAMEYTCEVAYQQLLRLLEETASAANTPHDQHVAIPQLSD